MFDKPILLTTAGTMSYVRYSATDLAVLMAKHGFPLPCYHDGRVDRVFWNQRDLDEWVARRTTSIIAGPPDSQF